MTIPKPIKISILLFVSLTLILIPFGGSLSQDKIDLKAEVARILDIFAQEELGNRLSQFAMISLKQMILEKIDQYEKQSNEEKDGKDGE